MNPVYQLIDNKYQKQGDFSDTSYVFELSGCDISFDFGFIWKK
jgi:hypothetical protein